MKKILSIVLIMTLTGLSYSYTVDTTLQAAEKDPFKPICRFLVKNGEELFSEEGSKKQKSLGRRYDRLLRRLGFDPKYFNPGLCFADGLPFPGPGDGSGLPSEPRD